MDAINHTQAQGFQQSGYQPQHNLTNQDQQKSQELSPAQAKPPRNGKIAKIRRSENSFRPGRAAVPTVPQATSPQKRLMFMMPASVALGTPAEAAEVQTIATQLASHSDIGKVSSLSLHDYTWEITISLLPCSAADEDEFLSNVFRALNPTIEALPNLCTGFRNGAASRWEYRIGMNLLDSGNFS